MCSPISLLGDPISRLLPAPDLSRKYLEFQNEVPMSCADQLFIRNCHDIMENGFSTEHEQVRPVWPDGTPAHTIKRFGLVNRYDLSREFPILTLRYTNFKACVDEILWIWQRKSNNIRDLNSKIWDAWADESGSIGKAYGYPRAGDARHLPARRHHHSVSY